MTEHPSGDGKWHFSREPDQNKTFPARPIWDMQSWGSPWWSHSEPKWAATPKQSIFAANSPEPGWTFCADGAGAGEVGQLQSRSHSVPRRGRGSAVSTHQLNSQAKSQMK